MNSGMLEDRGGIEEGLLREWKVDEDVPKGPQTLDMTRSVGASKHSKKHGGKHSGRLSLMSGGDALRPVPPVRGRHRLPMAAGNAQLSGPCGS
jgi:hypothetical protein